MPTKGKTYSTVKVPETVPSWKSSLYRKVWRAAFLILQDEALSRRIALTVVMPPAAKPSPAMLASVPTHIAPEKKSQWARIAQKVEIITSNSSAARQIANSVCGDSYPSRKSAMKSMAGVLMQMPGGSVKAVEYPHETNQSGWIEGYLVSWGNEKDTDLQGEFFSPRTEFCLDWFQERPVLYHHGMDNDAGLKKIGAFKTVKADDIGLWVQAQLDLRDRYARAVYDMVKAKQFGWSSGSVDHLVKIGENGEILLWPLIEGSVTPTPAQPAKTAVRPVKASPVATMQAYKAILNDHASEYLRELETRVAMSGENIQRVPIGVKTMSRYGNSSFYLTSAIAKAFGLKDVQPEEIRAVAEEVKDVVADEVAAAAAQELETEAAMQALEDEMGVAPVASYRGRARRGYGYRTEDPAAMMDDDLAAAMDDDLATMNESEAMEKAAARAIRRKAWKRAMRQLETEAAMEDDVVPASASYRGRRGYGYRTEAVEEPYLGEPAAASYRSRARRGYGYRAEEPTAMQDDLAAMQDDLTTMDEGVLTDVAAQAYRRGFRSGLNSAYRQVNNEPAAMQNDEVAAMNEIIGSDATMAEELVEEAARAYRTGYNKGMRRAMRQLEDPAAMEDDLVPAAASYRGRRGYGYRQLEDPAAMEDDLAAMQDDLTAMQDDLVPASASYRGRRGYGYRQLEDPAAMDDDLAAMEDDITAMQDDLAAMNDDVLPAAASYRGRRGQGYRSVGSVDYWRQRALDAELAEAPGQRAFKSIQKITDEADRPGAYERAFKTYLFKGTALLKDSEKYILESKGKARWENTTFSFDPATKSVKTYSTGSDASGGFLVPEDWVNELNKNILTQTVMAGECRTRTTTSDRIVQPSVRTTDARRAHGAVVRWPGEAPTNVNDHRSVEDTYEQNVMPIHVMLLSLTATNSALEDSAFNLEQEINEAFSEAVAIAYDQLIWAGDGQGKMQGIVVNEKVTGTASAGVQTPGGYIASTSATGIPTADVLKKLLFHLPQGYRQRAKWYMNSNTGLEIATLKDGEGNYLIDQRDESLRSVGIPDRLLGKPIVYNEWATDIAANAYPIVLGDLSRGYVIGRRVEFSIRRFDDSNYAENDQVLFLGRARLGGQVLQEAAIKVLKIAVS